MPGASGLNGVEQSRASSLTPILLELEANEIQIEDRLIARQACRRLVERRFLGGEAEPSRAVSAQFDSHRAADRHVLSDHEHRFLLTRRVGYLATADSRAIPHVVPICFTISQGTLYITIDEKPKRVAGPALKRVRNIAA